MVKMDFGILITIPKKNSLYLVLLLLTSYLAF